ncbi:MAG: zinc ribbon domain-containing protein [Pseudomonadota bacterium]
MSGTAKFPCANCGASLTFDPGVATLACPYCGAVNDLPPAEAGPWEKPEAELVELDLAEALAGLERGAAADENTETTTTIRCTGCGAEVSLGAGALAENCPFCATPLSKDAAHSHRHPRPQGVLPFSLDEREARERMKAWLGGLWFAPNRLKEFAEAGRPMQGVYVPHYTYDAAGRAEYRGMRGDAYYVTETVVVERNGESVRERRQVRKIRWSQVSGRVARAFDDVLVPASETLTEFARDAVVETPDWDLAGMQAYRAEYLAGFRAEAPSLALQVGFERAAGAMEGVLRHDARRDIGGDEQRITALRARFDDVTFKHVLLPVWLAAYRWNNTAYRVVVNARTGRVTGQRPYSTWKIALAVVAGLIVLGAIVFLAQMQQR